MVLNPTKQTAPVDSQIHVANDTVRFIQTRRILKASEIRSLQIT